MIDGDEQDSMREVEEKMGISTGEERVNPEDEQPAEPVAQYETPQMVLTHEQLIDAIRKLTAEINDRIEKRSKLRKAAQKIIGNL